MKRAELIALLSYEITQTSLPHPLRVAIDGIDASGKTYLAAELENDLLQKGFTVIRASIDGFHQSREIRYKLGEMSPEGYFLDSFDLETLVRDLLEPLGPSGSRYYSTENFNFRINQGTKPVIKKASEKAVLLFDGVFLQKEELKSYWDFSIFVDIHFETGLKRALSRDKSLFGNEEVIRERYLKRYYPGQEIYFKTCSPKEAADIVVKNNDPENPEIFWKRSENGKKEIR